MIGPLVAEIFEFENVDARTPDRPVYYKLTFEPSALVLKSYIIRYIVILSGDAANVLVRTSANA